MCLAPRYPDIKENLGASTTVFGLLAGSGAIGAISSQLTIGHVIHRLGVYKVLISSTFATYILMAILVEASNPWIFLITNTLCGFSWSAYHISINAQALHHQGETGVKILPRLHGLWSTGALATLLIAILVSSRVSLNWHLLPLIALVFIFTLRAINRLRPKLLAGNEVTEDDEVVTFRRMISSFSVDWVVSLGFLCALMLEVAMGDWSAILAKREFGVSNSAAVIPFFAFMSAIILGRFSFNRIKGDRSDTQIVKPFVICGGLAFIIGLFIGLELKTISLALGYAIFSAGCFLAGFGLSFIGPLFFGYASARSQKPHGVAIAELGAMNQTLTLISRAVIAVVAGATSLPIAMIIPGVALVLTAFFIAAASQPRK